jgi:hypothetical protein
MVNRAISSAKRHGIILAQGTPNKADGNCALESAILNVKDRDCFSDRLPFSVDYYRRIWMTDMKNRTMDDKTWNIYSRTDWEAGWNVMMESGVYEQGLFGDLMLFGIVCGLKKVMLIFNTSPDSPHDPVYICDPRKFGVIPDTEIPIVVCYNLSHYESLHPIGEDNIEKTIELVRNYQMGTYSFGKKDLPFLLNTDNLDGQINSEEKESMNIGENNLLMSGITTKDNDMDNQSKIDQKEDEQIKGFRNNLPENLGGIRPRDMTHEEKKDYNKEKVKLFRKMRPIQKEILEEKEKLKLGLKHGCKNPKKKLH